MFPIRLAPLRERRADIPLLMDSFLKRGVARHGKRVSGFTSHAVDHLLRYRWPGNVRELENMIERAIILCPDDSPIDAHHLFTGGEELDAPLYVPGSTGTLVPVAEMHAAPETHTAPIDWSAFARDSLRSMNLKDLMQEIQRAFVNAALDDSGGNASEAARNLGLSYGQVSYCLRRQTQDRGLPNGGGDR